MLPPRTPLQLVSDSPLNPPMPKLETPASPHSLCSLVKKMVYVYVCVVACMYVCSMQAGVCGDQERVLDPLELESQEVVNH